MRVAPCFYSLTAIFLLGSCAKDLSCYRDMIIGSWVEQSFDGEVPETRLKGVYRFGRDAMYPQVSVIRMQNKEGEGSMIDSVELQYDIYCKVLTINPNFPTRAEYEILKFTDSTLRLRSMAPEPLEITYKKVSKENANAMRIQNFWEMEYSSDPAVAPFCIRFAADGSYLLHDEAGTYLVFDTFLITSGASCWEINFIGTENEQKEMIYTQMNWHALVDENGQTITKTLSFTLAAEDEP